MVLFSLKKFVFKLPSLFLFVLTKVKSAYFFHLYKTFTFFLVTTLVLPPAYSQSEIQGSSGANQVNSTDDLKLQITIDEIASRSTQEISSLAPISLTVSDPKSADEITEAEISTRNSFLLLDTEIFKEIRHRLNIRFWQPLKTKSKQIYGYAALNIPRVAREIKEAFRHPLKSGKNVTIVTTFLGTASTITSFTIGNISSGETDILRLAVTGVQLAALSAIYRANFDSIGAFLTYAGWKPKDVKKNVKLQEVYEENIKNLKDEKPAGLVEDSLINRLIKNSLIEVFFLAAASSIDFLFPKAEKSTVTKGNFILANIEYTLSSFVDALLTRKMIEQKVGIKASSKEEIELKQNKISFIVKTISIGLAALQNFIVVKALSGDYKAHIALAAFGGSVVLYEYLTGGQKKNPNNLSCPLVFTQ